MTPNPLLAPLLAAILASSVHAQFPQPAPLNDPNNWQTLAWISSASIDGINAIRAESGLPILINDSSVVATASRISAGDNSVTIEDPDPLTGGGTQFATNALLSGAPYSGVPLETTPRANMPEAIRVVWENAAAMNLSGRFASQPSPLPNPLYRGIGIGVQWTQERAAFNFSSYTMTVICTTTPDASNPVNRALPGAIALGNGWFYSAFLGAFNTDRFPVLLVWGVGYAYLDTTMSNGYLVRLWDPALGWLSATTRQIYAGWYYQESTAAWLYRALDSTWPRRFYSFAESRWLEVY